MKKSNALQIIMNIIFLVVFNAVFFIAGGTDHKVSVWVSYGFIHFAYLILLLSPFFISNGESKALFGFSIYSISMFYFLLELITGVVFIFISLDSYKTSLLIQLCIAGLYGIVLISNMKANEKTADAEERHQYQISYIKDASAKLKIILESLNDKNIKKRIEQVYDILSSSPVKSHPDLIQIENRIIQLINDLDAETSTGDTAKIIEMTNALMNAVNERKILLRTLN